MIAAYLERWLEEVLATPGLTSLRDPAEARRVLLDDAVRALPVLDRWPGPVIDVGSGGGTPGIPLAAHRPDRVFTLLETQRRKCEFLERVTAELDNVTVVWGRAEEQQADTFGVTLAKALASPQVAVELCLPLVAPGGAGLLWLADSADRNAISTVAELLGGRLEDDAGGLVVLRKLRETPPGFPRRAGMARKRPLA